MSAERAPSERVAALLREEDGGLDELSRARLERRVMDALAAPRAAAAVAPPRRDRRPMIALGAVAIAVAAAIALVSRPSGPHFTIERAHGGEIAAGTVIEVGPGEEARAEIFHLALVASAGARVRFDVVEERDVRLSLEHGVLHLAFHPRERGREHVRIETPSASVEIVGTELSVSVDEHGTSVAVTEGRVRVTPRHGEPSFVSAGESLFVPAEGEAAEASDAAGPAPEGAALAGATAGVSAPEEIAPEGAETEPEAAAAALGADGTTRSGHGTGSPAAPSFDFEARLDRVEEALDDDPAGARRELRVLAGPAYPRHIRVRAYSYLGDSAATAAEAIDAYDAAARLGQGTALGAAAVFEGALARERSGNTDGARDGYARYLREYPDGPNAVSARRHLTALGGHAP